MANYIDEAGLSRLAENPREYADGMARDANPLSGFEYDVASNTLLDYSTARSNVVKSASSELEEWGGYGPLERYFADGATAPESWGKHADVSSGAMNLYVTGRASNGEERPASATLRPSKHPYEVVSGNPARYMWSITAKYNPYDSIPQYPWKHRYNPTDTTVGGWAESELRTWLNETLFGKLPKWLQLATKTVRVWRDGGPGTTEPVMTEDRLFIPSAYEAFGDYARYYHWNTSADSHLTPGIAWHDGRELLASTSRASTEDDSLCIGYTNDNASGVQEKPISPSNDGSAFAVCGCF